MSDDFKKKVESILTKIPVNGGNHSMHYVIAQLLDQGFNATSGHHSGISERIVVMKHPFHGHELAVAEGSPGFFGSYRWDPDEEWLNNKWQSYGE